MMETFDTFTEFLSASVAYAPRAIRADLRNATLEFRAMVNSDYFTITNAREFVNAIIDPIIDELAEQNARDFPARKCVICHAEVTFRESVESNMNQGLILGADNPDNKNWRNIHDLAPDYTDVEYWWIGAPITHADYIGYADVIALHLQGQCRA